MNFQEYKLAEKSINDRYRIDRDYEKKMNSLRELFRFYYVNSSSIVKWQEEDAKAAAYLPIPSSNE